MTVKKSKPTTYRANQKCKLINIFSQPQSDGIYGVVYSFPQTNGEQLRWKQDGVTQTQATITLGSTSQLDLVDDHGKINTNTFLVSNWSSNDCVPFLQPNEETKGK